jgi:hypothetical protein
VTHRLTTRLVQLRDLVARGRPPALLAYTAQRIARESSAPYIAVAAALGVCS